MVAQLRGLAEDEDNPADILAEAYGDTAKAFNAATAVPASQMDPFGVYCQALSNDPREVARHLRAYAASLPEGE